MFNENIAKTLVRNSAILGSGLTSAQKQVDNFMITRNFNSAIAADIRKEEKAIARAKELQVIFSLTDEQTAYAQTLLMKEENQNDKFSPDRRATLYAASLAQGKNLDGTYTIVSPKTGEHRTLRIETCMDAKSGLFGKRIIGLLVGSNKTTDFVNFAFLNSSDIYVWKNFQAQGEKVKNEKDQNFFTKLAKMFFSLLTEGKESDFAKLGVTIEASKQCLICSRKLTRPSSLDVNMGAKCYRDIHG